MLAFDPFALDRDIAHGARAARKLCRALRQGSPRAEEAHSLTQLRSVAGKTRFDAVSSMPEGDPFREPLRRWIFRLALLRIAREPIFREARAWHEKSALIEHPETLVASPHERLARILRERVPAKRAAWIDALGKIAPQLSQAAKERDEALLEIASRMGAPDPWALRLPCDRSLVVELARDFLDATDDLASELLGSAGDFSGWIELVLARDVRGSWPVRTGRFVEQVFDRTPLVAGLSIDTGPMPEALGASSFVRALARFGSAHARAAAPREKPFVLAHDPSDLVPLRRGALFGSLLADPVFLRRIVGLSRDEARQSARILARSLLGAVRLEASRVLANDARTPARDVEELHSRALGIPWPPSLANVLPKASLEAPVRFLAALVATSERDELIHRFDEDWFRNPHALEHLREDDRALTPSPLVADALAELPARLSKALQILSS